MKVIVLAAGQGYHLDGFNKLLLKHPITNERIIESYIRLFGRDNLHFVLGYRAINVIHNYSNLNYIYNSDWAIANNSLSLSIVLDETPCIVLSGDLFLDDSLVEKILKGPPNLTVTKNNDARSSSSLNIIKNNSSIISEIYQGKLKNPRDLEAMGIYKICDESLLKSWKKKCLKNKNLFVGQNLDFSKSNIYSLEIFGNDLFEINHPDDYLRYLDSQRLS